MCNIHVVFSAKRKNAKRRNLFFFNANVTHALLLVTEHTRWTPFVLHHLNRRCSAWSSAFLSVEVPSVTQFITGSRTGLPPQCVVFFSPCSHSITPHLLPVFLLIKERSYSSERGMAAPEDWTRTSLSFDFSHPLSFAIWLCRALYSLQRAKY